MSAPGRLAENVMHFGRLLRRAGLRVGPSQILLAVRAAAAVGPERREDFYWALAATLVRRPEDRIIFAEAFDTFWRDPFGQEQLLSMLLDQAKREHDGPPATKRRVREAWSAPASVPRPRERPPPPDERVDAVLSFSADEVLRKKDFEQMSADELARARALILRMALPVRDLVTRRLEPSRRGRVDPRRTLRRVAATGGTAAELALRRPRTRPPTLVVLCDISGSMERYSRMFLYFMHALTSLRHRVHSFVFGTRLSHVTRTLRHKDVDLALAEVGREVLDWSGGTRIRSSLHEFNQRWSRRVLGQGAIVLLVTDGLDRDVDDGLAEEADRLRRSCRRLIWLNPLLRYQGFEPLARGVRVLYDRVHEHRPVHDLESLDALVAALDGRARPSDGVRRPASRRA